MPNKNFTRSGPLIKSATRRVGRYQFTLYDLPDRGRNAIAVRWIIERIGLPGYEVMLSRLRAYNFWKCELLQYRIPKPRRPPYTPTSRVAFTQVEGLRWAMEKLDLIFKARLPERQEYERIHRRPYPRDPHFKR